MKSTDWTRGTFAHTVTVKRVVAQYCQHSCRAFVCKVKSFNRLRELYSSFLPPDNYIVFCRTSGTHSAEQNVKMRR